MLPSRWRDDLRKIEKVCADRAAPHQDYRRLNRPALQKRRQYAGLLCTVFSQLRIVRKARQSRR